MIYAYNIRQQYIDIAMSKIGYLTINKLHYFNQFKSSKIAGTLRSQTQ